MSRLVGVLLLAFCPVGSGILLTTDTWEASGVGKSVFLKFFAPCCGHCNRMKPDWDKLMTAYRDHARTLVADVDCSSTAGKPLCEKAGVRGYPTLKYGDPNALQDYKGGRDFSSLKSSRIASAPSAGQRASRCATTRTRKMIQEFQALESQARQKRIKEMEDESNRIEAEYKTFVDRMQKEYQQLQEKRDKDIEEARKDGLGLLKAVHAHAKNVAKNEL